MVSILFVGGAGLTLLLGMAGLFAPRAVLTSWGADPNPSAVYMARRYGGLFFGYAAMLWLGRDAASSPAGVAIMVGAAVASTLMMIVSLIGVLKKIVGPVVWSVVAFEAALAAAFWYVCLTAR